MLDKDKIKGNYSTDKDNVLGEFYLPTLEHATSYDRAVGYFSTKALLHIIQGLDGLINNGGKMRLVVGSPLTKEEYNAIKNNTISSLETREKIFNEFSEKWNELIHEDLDELNKYRLEVFSWLAKTNKLEIKFALRKKGLFHKKIGVIKSKDFTIVFNGSLNETESAFENNSENFDVYRSWRKEAFEDHGEAHLKEFEDVWKGKENDTITFGVPSKYYDDIKDYWSVDRPPKTDLEKMAAKKRAELFKKKEEKKDPPGPGPDPDGKLPYVLRPPQERALEKWRDNNHKGILALATGSGKTITAIHAAVVAAKKETLCVIIAVPYVVLAEQWVEVLNKYNVEPYQCFGNYSKWYSNLTNAIGTFNFGIKRFLPIIVVNATLNGKKFQNQLKKIENSNHGEIFMISDECHHHANESIIKKLPKAKYIMGLSATPWNKEDTDSKSILNNYYGDIVYEYTLDMALNDDPPVLCPYSYHIHEVEMNAEEEEEYLRLTRLISSLIKQKKDGTLSSKDKSMLDNTIFKRARLLDGIEDKFETLNEILKSKKPSPYKLFYCGSGFQASYEDEDEPKVEMDSIRIIDRITSILADKDWNVSKFTSEESHHDRRNVLQTFKKKQIDAIAAIKVLDEGFDVPMCNEAYFTASSSSERQWVQRRGRILRISDNKDSAKVHDFVITKTSSTNDFRALIGKEMARVDAFFKSCSNQSDIESQIQAIKNAYLIETVEEE